MLLSISLHMPLLLFLHLREHLLDLVLARHGNAHGLHHLFGLRVLEGRHHLVLEGCAGATTGGAGTTAAALTAGRPSLIVPFMVDQPWWGERLREQGLGPAALRPARFTAGRFARALKQIEA